MNKPENISYIDPDEDLVTTGVCKFCGQTCIISATPADKADMAATMQCTCEGARRERKWGQTRAALTAAMCAPANETGFPTMPFETQEIIKDVADAIHDLKVFSAQLELCDRTVKLKATNNGLMFQQVKKIENSVEC